MTQVLPRFFDTRKQDEQKIARILLETGEAAPVVTVTKATLPGDKRRLRGIPVAGGACGTSPGTDPLHETIRRMTQR